MQQLTTQTNAQTSWARLVHAFGSISQEMNARLTAEHGLTLNEYEVLLQLSRAEEHRMRRVDLANTLILSPSGITRMLDRLGTTGLVEKAHCSSDARVTYAVLTDQGMSKLGEASHTTAAAIDELFGTHLREQDLGALSEILGRLPGVSDEPCTVEDE